MLRASALMRPKRPHYHIHLTSATRLYTSQALPFCQRLACDPARHSLRSASVLSRLGPGSSRPVSSLTLCYGALRRSAWLRRGGGAAFLPLRLTIRRLSSTPYGTTIVSDADSAKRVLEVIYRVHKSDPNRFWGCDTEAAGIDLKIQSPIGHGRVIAATVYAGSDVDFGNGSRLFIDNLDGAEGTLELFKPFFEDESIFKVWHHYGFDRHILYNHGIDCKGFGGDTMHLARLLDPTRAGKGAYSLEGLSEYFLDNRKQPIKELFGEKHLKDGSVAKLRVMPDLEELQRDPKTRPDWIDYATKDAELTWELRRVLENLLKQEQHNHHLKTSMYDVYWKFWRPFGEVLTDMERAGIYLNISWLAQAQAKAEADAKEFWDIFRQWAIKHCPDAKFMNPKSTSQLQQLLFAPFVDRHGTTILQEKRVFKTENVDGFIEAGKVKPLKNRHFIISGLGLNPVSFTPNFLPSANSSSLAVLAGSPNRDPPKFGRIFNDLGGGVAGEEACLALDAAVKANRIEKLLNTYLVPLQTMVDSESRIHCSLNLNTETGRLSARKPNLQNQPSLEKDFYRIRQAFAAAPGKSLVIADYGQLELRLLAHLSKCKSMIEAFKAGGDFHSRTAIGMFDEIKSAVDNGEVLLEWDFSKGPSPKPLLKDKFASERRQAKTLNFSIAYGKTARGLANDWGVSVKEAEETLNRWYSDRPEVKSWQKDQCDAAFRTGVVKTITGRVRKVYDVQDSAAGPVLQVYDVQASLKEGPGIYNKNWARAQRLAINSPVQGSAADVVMIAMVKLWQSDRLKELGWKLLLQIHDEVILEGPSQSTDEALSIVCEIMEHPFQNPLRVDLVVDAKVVQNWYQAK